MPQENDWLRFRVLISEKKVPKDHTYLIVGRIIFSYSSGVDSWIRNSTGWSTAAKTSVFFISFCKLGQTCCHHNFYEAASRKKKESLKGFKYKEKGQLIFFLLSECLSSLRSTLLCRRMLLRCCLSYLLRPKIATHALLNHWNMESDLRL